VYTDLGEALGIEPFCVTIKENNMSYRENSLSEKEKLVFTYIREHPGTSKEDVVNNVKNYSRITILKTIKSLADDGLIFDKEDEKNSKRRHLFINSDNELASLIIKLDSFKESYFSLLDKTQLLEDNLVSNMPFYDTSKLIEAVVLPFKAMMLLIQYDLFGHIEKTPNKDLVEKKVNAAYVMMQQIHLKLYKSKILKMLIGDSDEEILIHLFMNTSNGLSPRNIIEILETFKKLGIRETIEKLISSLWEISYFILPFVDLHYRKYDMETIKNWRKVMSEFDYNPNKNKPIHFPSST
jgi:DNA-binding MarR family transcriptional regulator